MNHIFKFYFLYTLLYCEVRAYRFNGIQRIYIKTQQYACRNSKGMKNIVEVLNKNIQAKS